MRTATLVTALTFLVSGALAASHSSSHSSSHYSPDPAIVPHHVALIGAPRKLDSAPTATSPQLTCTTPAPWPFKCGVPGNLTTPETTITYTYADTFNDCRDSCVNNATCSAFGYDGSSNCTTVMKSLKANGFQTDTTDDGVAVWYNRKCFACTLVSNGTNFVNNYNFATGDLTYWNLGAPAVEPNADNGTDSGVTSPGVFSQYAFYTDLPAPGNLVYLSQVLDTIANMTYNIVFNYMVDNADVRQAIYVLAGDDDQTGASEFYVPPSAFQPGQWSSAQGTYVAQENSTIGFVFAASGNQTFYIDNVAVMEVMD